MAVQEVRRRGQVRRVHLQLRPQELTLHPAVAGHHHQNAVSLVYRQQLEAPEGELCPPGGGHIGRVAHQGGNRPARLNQQPVQLLHFQLEGLVDLLRLRQGEALLLHQLVDVEPVALGRRHPPGGGVGLLQVAQLRQVGQLVADGGGADAAPHLGGDGLGPHRLGSADVVLHHHFQYLPFSVRKLHTVSPPAVLRPLSRVVFECFSTPFPRVLKRVYHRRHLLSMDGYKQIVNKPGRNRESSPLRRREFFRRAELPEGPCRGLSDALRHVGARFAKCTERCLRIAESKKLSFTF